MMKKAQVNVVYYLLLGAVAMLSTGCFAPTVKTTPGVKLDTYRKVYIKIPEKGNDPRAVHPRVVSLLKQSGFQVVEMKSDEPIGGQGSGFVVSPKGDILTCAHVLGGQNKATAWINGTRFPCTVVASDTNIDLAVVRVIGDHAAFQPLRFASNTNYHMGQDVYTIGFPFVEMLGITPRLNKGLISSTVGLEDDPMYLQVSAPVQPGNSGGPLLNERVEVLGVVAATLNPAKVLVQSGGLPQNVNFAIKSTQVLEYLQRMNLNFAVMTNDIPAGDFETAKVSLALIRAGEVTDEDLKRPAAVCVCSYLSIWDMFFRFRAIQIDFFDIKKSERIFRVGQYRDDPFSSEDATLDHLFKEISKGFFADTPNSFVETRSTAPTPSKSGS